MMNKLINFNYVLGVVFLFVASGMAIVSASGRGEPPEGTSEVPPAVVGTLTIAADGAGGSLLTFDGHCKGEKFSISDGLDFPETPPADMTAEMIESIFLPGADQAVASYAPKCVSNDLTLGLSVSNVGHISHVSATTAIAHGVVLFFVK